MTEFTAGPWCNDPMQLGLLGDVSTLDGTVVAQAQQMEGDGLKQPIRAANARLIASAPDLLAACKVLLAGHHALNNSDISASEISCINGLPTDDQLESARAAIAKATGQQVAA